MLLCTLFSAIEDRLRNMPRILPLLSIDVRYGIDIHEFEENIFLLMIFYFFPCC